MPATEIATGCVDCVLSFDHRAPALVTMVTSMALYSVRRGIVSSLSHFLGSVVTLLLIIGSGRDPPRS
jgi:hypothetical protein